MIEFIEGTLSEKESRLLLEFLERNPELQGEMDRIEEIRLEPDRTEYPEKESLKQSLFTLMRYRELTYQEICVAFIEGDLEPHERELLMQYIGEDTVRLHDLELMKKTVLRPDTGIVYENKNTLRKPIPLFSRRGFYAVTTLAAAACVLLMLVFRQQEGSVPAGTPVSDAGSPVERMEMPGMQQLTTIASEGIRTTEAKVPPATDLVKTIAEPVRLPAPGLIASIPSRTPALIATTGFPAGNELRGIPAVGTGRPDKYLRPDEYLAGLIKKSLGEENDPGKDQSVFMELADAGFRKLEELTDDEFQFERKFDAQGNLRRLTLETPLFGISAPLKHSNSPK